MPSKSKKWTLRSLALFFVLLVFSIIAIWVSSRKTEAAWWNDLWQYRKSIAVTNSSGSVLTDFQVKILDNKDLSADITAGKIQASLADLRFTDINGNVLPYWIEDSTNSSVDAWVKMSSISTSGATVYMYYGNPQAVSIADGGKVFDFFDDFSGNLTRWQLQGSNWSISSGTMLHASTSNEVAITTYANTDFVFEGRVKTSASGTQYAMILGRKDTTVSDNGNNVTFGLGGNGYEYASWKGNGWIGTGSSANIQAGTWYAMKGVYHGTNFEFYGDPNVTTASTQRATTTTASLTSGATVGLIGSTSSNQTFDDLRIRKYASTDPSAGTPGTEEKTTAPVAYWSFDEGYGTTIHDETMNGQNLSFSGSPTWQASDQCVSDKCTNFDTDDTDYATYTVSSASPLNLGTSDFTVSHWQKVFQPTSYGSGIIGRYPHNTSYNGNWSTGISDDRTTYFFFHRNTSGETYSPGIDYTQYFGKWVYVTWVKSGSSFSLYIDGKLKQSWTPGITFNVSFSGAPFYISSTGWSPGTMSNLMIDELKIYSYARSAMQIKSDYVSGTSNMGKAKEGVGLSAGDQSDKWMTDGLTAYWKMDESSGNALDSSGNGNNATPTGTTIVAGKFGNARNFAAGTEALTIGSTVTPGNGSWSVSAWVKTSSNGSVFGNNNGGPVANDIGVSSGKIYYSNYDGSWQNHYGTSTINNGSWHFLTWVNFTGQTMNLYVDGVLESGGFNSYTTNGGPLNSIGRAYYGSMNGAIDELRYYTRSLSPSEITALYNWAPGPAGYWKMDEGTGTSAYDSSGNGNTGTLNNAATWGNGKFGEALSLATSGSTNNITAGTVNNYGSSGGLTLEAWVNPNSYSGEEMTVIQGQSTNAYYLSVNNDGAINCYWYGTSPEGYHSSGASTVPLNAWTHITCAWDGTNIRLYTNGILKNTVGVTGNGNDPGVINIGAESTARQFRGLIDEAKIYNYARTQKQIVEDMNGGHPAGGSPVGSQVGYWKLNEGVGTTAYNSISGNGNGVIRNSPSWSNSGKFEKALSLDGSNDYVEVASQSYYKCNGGDFSASIWINPASDESTGGLIFSKPWNGSGEYNWTFSYGSNKTLSLGLVGASTWSTSTGTTVPQSAWSHVAFTIEGATKAVKIYVNGSLAKSDTHNISSWTPGSGDNGVALAIGTLYPYGEGWGGDTGFSFKGLLDEAKIYNSNLSADEIKIDMDQGKSLVFGSTGTDASGNPSFSEDRKYCPPGDTTATCSPIGEWKLDEGTGTTTSDTSGNGYNGSFSGSPSWTQGKFGNALSFDGNDDYIDAGTGANMNITDAITLEAWVKSPNWRPTANWRSFLDKGGAYGFYVNGSSDFIRFQLNLVTDGNVTLDTGTLSTNTWYHLTGTYDKNAGSNNFKLYLNGRFVTSGTYSNSITTNNTSLKFGLYSGNYFNGTADLIRIYNYARTPAEVAYDYNRGKPIGWWKMDEGEGTSVYDFSGNGNTGTMTSMDPPNDWVTGKYNKALDFDGSDDYINMGTVSMFNFNNVPFSVSAWFKQNSPSGYDTIVSKAGFWGSNEWVLYTLSGNLYFYANSGSSYFTPTYPISNGVWYHAVGVYDGSYIKLYVNGNFVGQTAASGLNLSNSYNFRIGQANSDNFSGQIDDVRLFNYALTAEQVRQVANDGAVRYGP